MNFKNFLFVVIASFFVFSCTEVDNGSRGVAYKPYSGGLDKENIYDEGVHMGLSWMWNDMISYNIRQQSLDLSLELMDSEGLNVVVEATLLYRINPARIGYLHDEKGGNYETDYVLPITESICKNIVASFQGLDLNVSKRDTAQLLILQGIQERFAQKEHLIADDLLIRGVKLPEQISRAIVAKKEQDEKNLLSEKKKLEEENLAAARIAKAEGDLKVAELDAQTKQLLSQPYMLKLKELEIQELWAKSGKSPWGERNVFGTDAKMLLNMQ